ncbi:MAG: hypothetical protein D6820_02705 [Lentisphaerae bacterium]|nr:MAG: hypothetical protein D6820_02705 [Lentisphaerota bacterium]
MKNFIILFSILFLLTSCNRSRHRLDVEKSSFSTSKRGGSECFPVSVIKDDHPTYEDIGVSYSSVKIELGKMKKAIFYKKVYKNGTLLPKHSEKSIIYLPTEQTITVSAIIYDSAERIPEDYHKIKMEMPVGIGGAVSTSSSPWIDVSEMNPDKFDISKGIITMPHQGRIDLNKKVMLLCAHYGVRKKGEAREMFPEKDGFYVYMSLEVEIKEMTKDELKKIYRNGEPMTLISSESIDDE